MAHLSVGDYRAGLRLLDRLGELADGLGGSTRPGMRGIPAPGRSDPAARSVRDPSRPARGGVSKRSAALSSDPLACFNRFFDQHPPARSHDGDPDAGSCDVGDATSGPLARLYRQAMLLQRARAALAEMSAWMAAEGTAMVELSASGDVVRRTPRAARLLALYCGGARVVIGRPLPEPAGGRLRQAGLDGRREAVRLRRDGGELALRAIALPDDGRGSLVLLRERAMMVTPWNFQSLPVTTREREVLTWLAAGKTDREIGAILGISARTVQKHLERLYVKLGVESRTAAVMRSLALVSAAPASLPAINAADRRGAMAPGRSGKGNGAP